jgi:HSP20 family protein
MIKKPNHSISFPMHLSREVERLFDEIIHRPWGFCRDVRGWNPSLDLYGTADAFIIEADLPGVKADDLQIDIENNFVVLRGWRSLDNNHDGRFHTMERSSGYFMRRMELPESADKDAKVEFCDGVVRVILLKSKRSTARPVLVGRAPRNSFS